ncbi:hypothetical protein [Treponema endosymbiont of Eucomonympha sp.]|uniref:hypothetical protein n=1 Tax=Treponema endosymbiont of Eucomonympha sp. TaxID=1580831 RepID=UPI000A81AE1A|nr:hypothetical protein [Treponema endosymbiont of Eucomonympha sp.]
MKEENKESPLQTAGYQRFLLKSLRMRGKQIPRTPSFPQQATGYQTLEETNQEKRTKQHLAVTHFGTRYNASFYD